MLDLAGNVLQLVRALLDALPSRLRGIISVGLFILGSMVVLVIIRRRIGDDPVTILTRHLVTGIDAALIALLSILLFLIIASVIHVIFYHEA